MSLTDAYGLPVTAASRAAVDVYDRGVRALLGFEISGRHAQRELFHDTLLAAALRAELYDRARPLLERRLAMRPNPGRYWTAVQLPPSEGTRA